MENPKTTLAKTIRVSGMVLGFAIFIMFVIKASLDVSSAKIAAGAERRRALAAASQAKSDQVAATETSYSNKIFALPQPPVPAPSPVTAVSEDTAKTAKSVADDPELVKEKASIKQDGLVKNKSEIKRNN